MNIIAVTTYEVTPEIVYEFSDTNDRACVGLVMGTVNDVNLKRYVACIVYNFAFLIAAIIKVEALRDLEAFVENVHG